MAINVGVKDAGGTGIAFVEVVDAVDVVEGIGSGGHDSAENEMRVGFHSVAHLTGVASVTKGLRVTGVG